MEHPGAGVLKSGLNCDWDRLEWLANEVRTARLMLACALPRWHPKILGLDGQSTRTLNVTVHITTTTPAGTTKIQRRGKAMVKQECTMHSAEPYQRVYINGPEGAAEVLTRELRKNCYPNPHPKTNNQVQLISRRRLVEAVET